MRRRALVAAAATAASLLLVTGLPWAPPVATAAPECTVKWYGTTGTPFWHDAGNWNTGVVPATSDVVCIEDGFYVVHTTGATIVAHLLVNGDLTLAGGSLAPADTSNVHHLTISGGSFSPGGELTVTGQLVWTGGTLGGSGSTIIAPTATGSISDPATKVLTGLLRNDGALTWSAGLLQMASGGNGPHLDNHGTLTISGAVSAPTNTNEDIPRFTNRAGATIVKTGPETAVLGDLESELANDGSISVSGGTLWLNTWLTPFGGSDLTTGTWNVASGATLKLRGADLSTNSASIALLGPGASFQDSAGNDALRHLATNAGTLTLAGGRDLAVPGQFANDGTLALGPGSELTVAEDFYAGNGRLEVGLAGTGSGATDGHGQVIATGTAWLGGTLAATVVAPFVPSPTDQFDVLSGSVLTGSVATVEGGLFVTYDRIAGRVRLTPTDPYPGCGTVFSAATGTWTSASNWSAGEVPSGDDTACIPDGATAQLSSGTYVVNALQGAGRVELLGGSLSVTGESSLGELGIAGGTLSGGGQLTVTERIDWSAGTVAGAGALVLASGATGAISSSGSKALSRTLRNDGALEWLAGSITMRSDLGGVARLDNHGTFTIAGTGATTLGDGSILPSITNRPGATIVKVGSQTSALGSTFIGFVNDGTITVADGTLSVAAGPGSGSGTWALAPGGLILGGRDWDLTGNLAGPGTLTLVADSARFSGAARLGPVGRVVIKESTLDVDSTPSAPSSVGVVDLNEGIITGDGDLNVTGSFVWGAGNLEGSGALVVAAGATATMSTTGPMLLGRHLRNDGTLTWSQGTLTTSSSGDRHPHLDNYGSLDITGAVATSWTSGTTPPQFTNRPGATITKTGVGLDATLGNAGSSFDNQGTISVLGGDLWLDVSLANLSGGTLTGGTWQVSNGELLKITNAAIVTNSATIVIGTGSAITNQSGSDALESLVTNNGTLRLAGGDLVLHGAPGYVLTNNGALALGDRSEIEIDGGFTQTTAGRLELEISGNVAALGHGVIGATGAAAIAGTISSSLVGGFSPSATDQLTVIDATTLTGSFAAVEGPLGVTYDRTSGNVVLSTGGATTCTVSWDGSAGDGWWDTAANWSTGSVPASTDHVCIPDGSTASYRTGTSTIAALDADGALTVTGGTLSVAEASTVADLNVTGGILDGAGPLTVGHSMGWTGGVLRGAGTLTIATAATATIDGTMILARHLRNDGTFTWQSGAIWLTDHNGTVAHLDNHATFTITNGTFATWSYNNPTPPQITNQPGATITKTTPGTTTLGDGGSQLTNNGTITVTAGVLDIGGGTASGGTGSWITNATLNFKTGTFELSGPITGTGTVSTSGATVHVTGATTVTPTTITVTNGTLDLDTTTTTTVADLNVTGGILDGAGPLTVGHSMGWTGGVLRGAGTLTIATAATATIDGTMILARHLRNDGTFTWQSGAIWLTDHNGTVAHLDNHATFTITNGTFATWSYNNPTPPQITNQPGATITKTTPGTTTLGDGGSQLTNNGTITVGSASDLAIGGPFTQGSTGRLEITVAGTNPGTTHGRVRIPGSATLGGTLASNLAGGFTPAEADRFVVLDATTMTGTFASVEGPLVAEYDTAQAQVVLRAPTVPPVPPTVQVVAQQTSETEGVFQVEVRGVGGNTSTVVPVLITGGTATADDDFSTTVTPATVTVLPDTSSFVAVAILDDSLDEDDEAFTVTAGAASAPMTIHDDDQPPLAVIDGLSVTEGDGETLNATLAVRLVDPLTGLLPQASGRTVLLSASTQDGTAVEPDDYTATDAVIQLSPGSTGTTFSVPIVGDELDEDDESFTVTLVADANATVAEGESATVLIIDEDATGPSTLGQQLETGGVALFDLLDDWGAAYDLDQAGPSPFELPGVTDELASLYEPQDDLAALNSPLSVLDDDLGTLLGQLQARGLTIDWVEGGVGGFPVPPSAPDIIQVRYTTTLSDLAEALGYTGDDFNDDAPGVLQGLATALGIDAELDSSADLLVTLVVGVDETGFYVADESGLRLDVSATGTMAGTGTVAGVDGAQVHGPATVAVSVLLQADGGASRLRAADLAGSPLAYLRPAASGTVGLSLDATAGPLALSWDSTFTLDVASDLTTSIAIDATLGATLTLPGVTAGGSPAAFELVGTFDGTTWTLTGHGDTGTSHAIGGYPVGNVDLTAVLDPSRLDGTLDADLHTVLGDAGVPVDLTLDGSFDHAAWHGAGHVALGELTLGASPALLWLRGVRADAAFDGALVAGTLSGGVTVAADVAVLLPQPTAPGTEPEGAARAEAVSGSLDSNGNLTLHAGSLSGSIGDAIDFTVAGADLHVGPTETGPIFSVASATATMPSLNGLGITFTDLHLGRDGRFGAGGIDVSSQGLLQTIGLGGIVPFDVTAVSVVFPDHEDLDRFDVTVTGHVDFAAMEALPFDPVIGLGGPPISSMSPPEDNVVTFAIAVDSLSEGQVRPLELGPITIGFANLEAGGATLGAQLTLGGYHLGQFDDTLSGTVSILSGFDDILGDTTVDVGGSLAVTPTGATLDLDAAFSLSATFGHDVTVEGATFDLALGIATDANLAFTITGPTFTATGVARVEIAFGDYLRLVGTNVDLDLSPEPGQPLITFGGAPGDGSLAVEFVEADVFSGWSGEAGNIGIGADGTVLLLPGFFLDVTVPDGTQLGLPDWLPLRIDEVGIRFPDVDLTQIPPEGIPLEDLAAFALRFSGGIEATDIWPVAASVDELEVDLGKLSRGEFPITNLTGLKMGVEPFELAPGFEVGGGLELGTVQVDADAAAGDQPQDVLYGRLFGEFSYDGLGAGIDLVISQYGPVLARLEVPLAIPLDGGALGGILLSSVEGGLAFGGPAFPDPQRPLDILHDPAFDTDFPVDEATIRAAVEPAVQRGTLTWDAGFTLAMSGNLTHALAPGIVTGDVTLGANVGLIPGQTGLKLIGSGDISVWGMSYTGAALLIDLADPLAPSFDFAFETPQLGNPLSFLMPAQAQLEGSFDTTGLLAGFDLGARTFVDRLSTGTLDVGQGFFDAAVDAVVADLEADHHRALARLVLDANRDGLISADEDAAVITRNHLLLAVSGALIGEPVATGRVGQLFIADLLSTATDVLYGGGSFDLADVFTKADYVAFAQLLGAGNEAVAALSGVMRRAVLDAGSAFWSTIDPSFHLRGALQPIILGIPFGEPSHSVEVIITKDGLGFGFDTSVVDISQRLADSIVPFAGGAALSLMQLGLEDHLGMTVELPIGGVVEGLFGGSGLPTIDPMSGDWAIELRGGLKWFDFEVGQMTGLVISAGNQAFLDAHVQKLYEDPDAPLDTSRIPIQRQQHYDDLLAYGGILLNGRLLLPELLTDPVGLLSTLNLPVPDNPLEMPQWVAGIADHLSRVAQPATVQLYLPGFGSVVTPVYDAATELGRLQPIGSGPALADAVNRVFAAAYIEGTFDGTLLSVPFGSALVEGSVDRLSVEGVLPLIGLRARFELDTNPTAGTNGLVPLPRAIATVTIDEADLDGVLARFGLPPLIGGVAGVDASFRAVSPGYDPASTDPLLRTGGLELAAHLSIDGLVRDGTFLVSVTPSTTGPLPDLVGHAAVGRVGPLAGVEIHGASVDIVQHDGRLSVGIDGTAKILGATARVHGELDPDLTGTLAVDFDTGGPRLAGFDVRTGWVLTVDREGGELVATLSYDGEVGFPVWLSTATGQASAHATGTVSSDGRIELALDVTSLNLFGFALHSGTFRLVGDPNSAQLAIDAQMSFLGTNLGVSGALSLGSKGPSGTLALSLTSGSALAFGPVSVRGALALTVATTKAEVSATGTADVPGIANGLGVTGSITSAGTGNLSLTATSLGIKGFSLSRLGGSPPPPLARITRTATSTSMAVDARFDFLGTWLDVDGSLALGAGGPSGSLALTYGGSVNIPFGGWTFEGGVTMAITPSAASIAVSSRIDIPGIASNLATSGSLDTSLRGSMTVSAGSLRLGPSGSPFSIAGSFTLSRSGTPAVISLGASGVSLAWTGVATFALSTFSIGSDGHFDAVVPATTVTISQFGLAMPSSTLHVGPNASGVQLQVGPSSLTITGIGTLAIPAFNVDTTDSFSVTLAATHMDLSGLDLDGRLIFQRQSGVFRLQVTGTTRATPARFSIPGFATISVDSFTIASDSTFDVAASTTRLGPDALSIRGASIRVRKTGSSITTLKVRVTSGDLYLPVGDPIALPTLEIDGDATWSQTFTATGIYLGPALRTSNDPSFTVSLSGGVLRLSLNAPLGVTVLSGSIGMSLRTLAVESDGTFEGSVRGQLRVLGYLVASTTYDVSLSNGVVRMRIPSSSPVSVDLGPVSGRVSGSVYSDGTFSFSGSAALDLTLGGVGLRGTATVRLRDTGLSGSFTGQACVGVCIDVVGGSISSRGVLTVVIAGITYRVQVFDPPQ